jgi:23S rRNA (cytosine1962-C5)-methyltransferase
MVEFPDKQWKDYELLDSGCGEKLERFGSVVMARPEPKALWNKSLPEAEWRKLAHVAFKLASADGKSGGQNGKGAAKSGAIEDRGTWERHKKIDDQWYISYPGLQDGLKFRLRLGLTAFKHVGVFPEQAPNWEFIFSQVRRLASDINRPKVLNLFAYTGGASLAAKAAGADVTHLDSIKQVVTWARGNMEASGMDGIRWIVEDAMKFVQREERRGNLYDGIILDPPAYGHGPNGEKWKLDESLFGLLKSVAHILKPKDSFMVLNLYSNGYSAALGETLVREAFGLGSNGRAMPVQSAPCGSLTGPLPVAAGLSSGELALPDPFGKTLPLSIYVRLTR